MRALLDTHAFIWTATDDPRLSTRMRDVVGDGENEIFFSAVSAWEIAIKYALGRLDFPADPVVAVPERVVLYGLTPLPVAIAHALIAGALPAHHRDPFDRLLIAQAQAERLPIITSDPNIARYDVEVIC